MHRRKRRLYVYAVGQQVRWEVTVRFRTPLETIEAIMGEQWPTIYCIDLIDAFTESIFLKYGGTIENVVCHRT